MELVALTPDQLAEQQSLNDLVRHHLRQPTQDKGPPPVPAAKPDVLMVRAGVDGIKGFKASEFRVYGAECDMLDMGDSEDMVTAPHKDERKLKYKKTTGGTTWKQFVINPHENPVPPYAVFMARLGPRGEYFVIPHEWELDAVVANDFTEPDAYDDPITATVSLVAFTGDAHPDPLVRVPVVTDVSVDVTVRGKGLNLQTGVPCRIKTIAGEWRFSWTDCDVDTALETAVESPQPYPDPFEEV